jgi:hypothetical protein
MHQGTELLQAVAINAVQRCSGSMIPGMEALRSTIALIENDQILGRLILKRQTKKSEIKIGLKIFANTCQLLPPF